ncbi:MAG: hypothetical protein KIT27_09675, partial [Legionellales bacterium]|nr:hypothetical protein [Legionellales bacterium]
MSIQLESIVLEISNPYNAIELLRCLTENQLSNGNLLYETQHHGKRCSQLSLGIIRAGLMIAGRENDFFIRALHPDAESLLATIGQRLPQEAHYQVIANEIRGTLTPDKTAVELNQRLQAVNHADLLRALLVPLQLPAAYSHLPLGLFGCFGYDFIQQMEHIPRNPRDILQDYDYIFYLPAEIFIIDHQHQQTYLIGLILDDKPQTQARLQTYQQNLIKHK